MSSEERASIVKALREAIAKRRGYADFFGWATDRDLEEWGVLDSLLESMQEVGPLPLSGIRVRGRGNDPPDCEALNASKQRVAIEVTELVDGGAIAAHKVAKCTLADWDRDSFLRRLGELLEQKDARFPRLKDAPFEGGYMVLVFTDEPTLRRDQVQAYLDGHAFSGNRHITEAFFLISYDPVVKGCPYFRLDGSS